MKIKIGKFRDTILVILYSRNSFYEKIKFIYLLIFSRTFQICIPRKIFNFENFGDFKNFS